MTRTSGVRRSCAQCAEEQIASLASGRGQDNAQGGSGKAAGRRGNQPLWSGRFGKQARRRARRLAARAASMPHLRTMYCGSSYAAQAWASASTHMPQSTCRSRGGQSELAALHRTACVRPILPRMRHEATGLPSLDEMPPENESVPDVRDGLTRRERIVLSVLRQTQMERGDRNVPTTMLWGRVCEHFYVSPEELSGMLARLGARR